MAIQKLIQKNSVDKKPECYAKIYSGKHALVFKKHYKKKFGDDIKILKVYENQFTGSSMAMGYKKSMIFGDQYAVIYSSDDFSIYSKKEDAEKQFKEMYGDMV